MEALYTKLSAMDYKALGPAKITRAQAIAKGEAFEYRSWGPAFAARGAVRARPAVKAKAKFPIAPADYQRLSLNDRLARAYAAKDGTPWSPEGYDRAFNDRVAVR